MLEIGKLLLAWFLGILTKFIWDRINQKRIQKSKDHKALIQARNALSGFKAIYESNKRDKTSHEYFDELYGLTFEIRREENKDIVNKIEIFVKENKGTDPISHRPLREKIESLMMEVEKKLDMKGDQ